MITNPRRFPNNGQGDGAKRPSARAVATELYTLGGVRVTQQGAPLDVNLGSKHLALLIYLFHERRPMHPSEVVELLGHGQGYDRELDGLKRTVKWLNQSVPFVNIRETSETIEGVGGVWLDTTDVEAAIDARKPVRVAKLYIGEFLEGFESGVQTFDEWAKKERGRLKRAWEHAMTRAAREASEDGKWRTAAEWWRIAVARAPMRSEPVAHLLEAYARTGRHEEAMQAYSDYSDRLRRSGVSDVPGVIKQVIARFPMLQRIALKPRPSSTEVRPLARELPQPERQPPPWDLEPAPAPPDAFDLTFELPEVEIPIRPGPLTSASPADRPVPNAKSRLVAPTHSFHALDEPVRPEFALGVAREGARGLADELLVETVAMSFEKIAADSLDPDPADRNGGARAGDAPGDDEAESTGHPEGFDGNSIHDLRDGNGAPPARSETPEKSQPKPSPKPPEARGVKGEKSRGGDAEEPTLADSPPGKFRGPPRDKADRDRDRDLYRATAAILAAFVEDGDDASGERDDQRVTGFRPSAKADFAERPVTDSPDPWADFGSEPSEEEAAESRAVADAELESTPSVEPADFTWEAPSQGPATPWEGRAVPFEESDTAGLDLADLSLDESDLYGGQFTRVRHEVTSVRKPWGPVLRNAWAGVSGWFAESFGGLWERLRRSRVNGQRIDLEEHPGVADYFEPWAAGEAAYTTPVQDDSEHVAREAPTGFSGYDAPASSRYGLQADASEEAWGRSDQVFEEEAPVEWYEEWQPGPTDASVDEAYEAEGDLYAPAAERESVERVAAARIASLLRRHWYAPVGVIVLAAALSFAPKLIGLFGGDAGETAVAEEPSAQEPSLPKIKVRAPAFVQTSISKISQLFSGAILEAPGEWVVVADLQSSVIDEVGLAGSEGPSGGAGAADLSPAALTLALEADLMQARFFFVFPRGRALAALGSEEGGAPESFSVADALSLAAAEGISAVIAGTLYRGAGGDRLVLDVIRPNGDTAYSVSRPVSDDAGRLAALSELTRAVRRRLGEPAAELEASMPMRTFLSENPEAVNSYAESFEHFRAGRFQEARQAASAATQQDSAFAAAHYLLARSLAALGARRQALSALRATVEVSERATERERLRIVGDWLAWTGRLSDAALTYDELFDRHRDDVGALRSQAIVQRLIGAPGGGLGNLRVASSIDHHDWPSLALLAQYLGYRGPLPSGDSLRAATGSAPSPEPDE